jgi:hypothetical protein
LTWLRPAVEVAPLGQARLWRFAKVAGPFVLTIVGAAIVKALFPVK